MTVYPKDTDTVKFWEATGVKPDHIIKSKITSGTLVKAHLAPIHFYDRGEAFNNLMMTENYPGGEMNVTWKFGTLSFRNLTTLKVLTNHSRVRILIRDGARAGRFGLSNAKTNFETDLFLPIIHKTEELSDASTTVIAQDDVSFKVMPITLSHYVCY